MFLEKVRKQYSFSESEPLYGATRIIKPSQACTLPILKQITKAFTGDGTFADVIAAIPERWAMIAVAHQNPDLIMTQLETLLDEIKKQGLMLD